MISQDVFSVEFANRTMAMLNVQINLAYKGFITYNDLWECSIETRVHVETLKELWQALQIIKECNQHYKERIITRGNIPGSHKYYVISLYF